MVLRGDDGLQLETCGLGAAVVSLTAFDRHGSARNVVLGLDATADYERSHSYFGASVGRFANRIRGACFRLENCTFATDANEGANTLHGGRFGFHRAAWTLFGFSETCVRYELVSPDGDMGFPGEVRVAATYSLVPGGGFIIEYVAVCDRPTVVGMANHTYFNLRGEGCGDILTHEVSVFAESYLPVGPDLVPTGEIRSVAGSAFDLRSPRNVGEALACDDPQFTRAGGFDHNFCLGESRGEARLAAYVREPCSGRALTVSTTEPGLQFYTGQQLDGSEARNGAAHARFRGFCMEAQVWPNAPNEPSFPSALLRPGERYLSRTCYALTVYEEGEEALSGRSELH